MILEVFTKGRSAHRPGVDEFAGRDTVPEGPAYPPRSNVPFVLGIAPA